MGLAAVAQRLLLLLGRMVSAGSTMLRVSCTTVHFSSRSAAVVLVMDGLAFTCNITQSK
jgi:hypothetical protein